MTRNFFVGRAQGYHTDELPWNLKMIPNRLVKYLAGGGMMAFGRTMEQDKRDRRQNRFLAAMGAIGTIYLILWAL